MGKYEPLGEFLRNQRTQEVPLTFNEIEKITGAKLPPKAQHHRAWWSNNSSNNVMTKVWLEAGYEKLRRSIWLRANSCFAAPEKPEPETQKHRQPRRKANAIRCSVH